jgi:hypothetical protein
MVRLPIDTKNTTSSIRIGFTDQRLTAHGGMILWSHFLHQQGFRKQLRAVLPHCPSSPNAYDPSRVALGYMGGILCGADKLSRVAWLQSDAEISDVLGVEAIASQSTFSRFFDGFDQKTCNVLNGLHQQAVFKAFAAMMTSHGKPRKPFFGHRGLQSVCPAAAAVGPIGKVRTQHPPVAPVFARRRLESRQGQTHTQTGGCQPKLPILVARNPGQTDRFTQLQCSWLPPSLNPENLSFMRLQLNRSTKGKLASSLVIAGWVTTAVIKLAVGSPLGTGVRLTVLATCTL